MTENNLFNQYNTEFSDILGFTHVPNSDGPFWQSLDDNLGDSDGTLYLPTVTVTASSITFSDAPYAGFFDWDQDGIYEPWDSEFALFAAGNEDLGLPTSYDVEQDTDLSTLEVQDMIGSLLTYFTPFATS